MNRILATVAMIAAMLNSQAQTGSCKTEKSEIFQGEFGSVFKAEFDLYQPKEDILNKINFKGVKIIVILGFWCEDSQREVPRFLKIAQNKAMKKVRTEYHSVNREKYCNDPAIQALKVGYVPTLIFFRKEQEVGRIVESTEKSLEEDMLKILGRKKS
jgi:thiol-disulfide isomerase/thioredoxin